MTTPPNSANTEVASSNRRGPCASATRAATGRAAMAAAWLAAKRAPAASGDCPDVTKTPFNTDWKAWPKPISSARHTAINVTETAAPRALGSGSRSPWHEQGATPSRPQGQGEVSSRAVRNASASPWRQIGITRPSFSWTSSLHLHHAQYANSTPAGTDNTTLGPSNANCNAGNPPCSKITGATVLHKAVVICVPATMTTKPVVKLDGRSCAKAVCCTTPMPPWKTLKKAKPPTTMASASQVRGVPSDTPKLPSLPRWLMRGAAPRPTATNAWPSSSPVGMATYESASWRLWTMPHNAGNRIDPINGEAATSAKETGDKPACDMDTCAGPMACFVAWELMPKAMTTSNRPAAVLNEVDWRGAL
mmetsp:Transcript_98544/g.284333  ORF Transcript_98544/g.284333 Transcript_98544/m.284333 type:complete len:363 (+) Transcript_98544:429-1517(+)